MHREGDEKKKAYQKEDTRRWSLAGELAGMAFDSREEENQERNHLLFDL